MHWAALIAIVLMYINTLCFSALGTLTFADFLLPLVAVFFPAELGDFLLVA